MPSLFYERWASVWFARACFSQHRSTFIVYTSVCTRVSSVLPLADRVECFTHDYRYEPGAVVTRESHAKTQELRNAVSGLAVLAIECARLIRHEPVLSLAVRSCVLLC